MKQDKPRNYNEERKNYEDYKKNNQPKAWNFPFRDAFEKLFGKK